MLINSTVLATYIDQIGFQQASSGIELTGLLTSNSGLYYGSVHPLLTVENLVAIAPDFATIMDGDTPLNINTAFTDWLTLKVNQYIISGLRSWVAKKTTLGEAKTLIESRKWLSSEVDLDRVELVSDNNNSDAAGLKISTVHSDMMYVRVNRFSWASTVAQSLLVNVYDTSTNAVVFTTTVNHTGVGEEWFDIELYVPTGSDYLVTIYGGAKSYVNTLYDDGIKTNQVPNYIDIEPFIASGVTVGTFPTDYIEYTGSNFGLNLDFDVVCDYTDFLVKQVNLLDTMLMYWVGMCLLKEIKANPYGRVNLNSHNYSIEALDFEIYGDPRGDQDFSINGQFKSMFDAARFNTDGIDKYCMTCKKKGVTYKTIGIK